MFTYFQNKDFLNEIDHVKNYKTYTVNEKFHTKKMLNKRKKTTIFVSFYLKLY